MRKRRGWLIGFGLGIAIGAMVLQIMTAAESAGKQALPNEPLSREELQKEAEAQGLSLVDPKAEGATYTQKELDDAVAKAKEETAAAKAASGATDGQGGQSAGEAASASEQPDVRTLYVWRNAKLVDVANALFSLGLIYDKDAFIRQAKPYSTKLRVGPCTFTGKPTFDEIIAELTRSKD